MFDRDLFFKHAGFIVFGSEATQGIHTQCIVQSALENCGIRVGMLKGAGTHLATWFYIMLYLIRLKTPLLATIHQQTFRDLDLNARARHSSIDIQDVVF